MRAFIIDGAYSIYAQYRRLQGRPWNPQEQLSEEEKERIRNSFNLVSPDIILSHTCPITWQPTDLFLSEVDQTTVDNSMEFFLEEIAGIANYKAWCWGHFHETREYGELKGKPGRKRMMIFQDFIPLKEIVN